MIKTIFITCYHAFVSRNIFNTDVLKVLKDKSGLRIVILSPSLKKEFLQKYYGDGNVIIENLDLDGLITSKLTKFWYRLAFLFQNSKYVKDQRKERLYNHQNVLGYLNYFLVNSLAAALSRLKPLKKAYKFLDSRFYSKNFLNGLLDKYSPHLIFSTDIFGEADTLIIKEGKRRKFPVIGMVRSWDNTTTKGILRTIPEKIIVNSPALKDELIRFHDVKEESVFVAGLPQFDGWFKGPSLTREGFFSKIGADPKKRLILFSPAGNVLSDTDWQICDILKDAMDKKLLPPDIQFLVRNHPAHPADFSKFKPDEHFIIEFPGTKFKEGDKETEINPDDQAHLLNSVFYSEIIMYIATTLGLDATVFNKPQIIVSFDGWEKKPYVESVKRYHNEDNLQSLIRLNGSRVVKNKEDLIYRINQYLKNPELDQGGRKRIIQTHLYKLDSKAGGRVANFILDCLK